MKGSQLAVRGERVGYNAGMIAFATRQIETAKQAVMPRADARAGEEKSATVFTWSDDDAHITISGPSTHGLHGFYDQEPSEVASVDQSNQQYSILALTDSSGNVSERYAYPAYGQPTFLNASAAVQTSSAASNRYTYTAREWDATLGLHHFRARWMSWLTGRFLTRDPIGYADGLGAYNNYFSIQETDPTGNSRNPIRSPASCGVDPFQTIVRRLPVLRQGKRGWTSRLECHFDCSCPGKPMSISVSLEVPYRGGNKVDLCRNLVGLANLEVDCNQCPKEQPSPQPQPVIHRIRIGEPIFEPEPEPEPRVQPVWPSPIRNPKPSYFGLPRWLIPIIILPPLIF